jgi:endogenous inhibitor of DNA gyrase (YacG/DUF329 family)
MPYRGELLPGTCPRCGKPATAAGDDELRCENRCGAFLLREHFDPATWERLVRTKVDDVGTDSETKAFRWGGASCPRCLKEMGIGSSDDVRYEFCLEHGLWIDEAERDRFATLLGA